MRTALILATLPLLAGCIIAGPIVAEAGDCSSLVPDSWRLGVEGAALPAGDLVGDWIAFADAQTAQLDKANGRTVDAIGIVERCEERDRRAVDRSRPKFLGVL